MPECIVKLLSWLGSKSFLFLTVSAGAQFQGEPLQQGRKIHGVEKILRFSIEITVYLGNSKRWAHGCYGMLIGSQALYRMVTFSMTLTDPYVP